MFKKTSLKNHQYSFLPIVFENEEIFFCKKNDFYKNINYIFFYNINILKSLKFFYNFKPIQLVDITSYDYLKLKAFEDFSNSNHVWSIYNFFSFKLNSYSSFIFVDTKLKNLFSIENFFKNANWLEREQKEGFGLDYIGLSDTRNILLDYNYTKHIMLKKEEINMNLDKNSDDNYENTSFFFDYYTI